MIVRSYRGKTPRIGARVFLAENVTLIGDVEIGDDSSIWYGTVLRGDVYPIKIGARSNIQDNCTLHVTNSRWAIEIEDEVTLGHGVIAHGCTIRRGSLIGMGSRILDGSEIGARSLIGAAALVTEGMSVPAGSLVLGSPGRVKRPLTEEEDKGLDGYWKNYLEYKEHYLAESPGSHLSLLQNVAVEGSRGNER
ncbi:MAG TPA: gamma carbonic anhydrase family protein [Thermoanaerobaculia bacterium]|nr:gamma carbonic anhydrase family protein [Thermoanaerobaculia bacterium]